ncbi:MAG: TusE/DsrC/DsvC family sulfur relay protein [Sterolibacteriaceae bacterium MAG5]|nr:TusE/DsrC/DsvC family sulfur relay protein [Candidatus Nitricoxidireducens bremensis]
MHDINQTMADPRQALLEQENHLAELDARWSPRLAARLAAEAGLELEEDHWVVIFHLRERFRELGPDWTARQMTRELERNFAAAGGRRFLYGLFPHGPLAQACRLAGLPLPHGTLSASFGSVH